MQCLYEAGYMTTCKCPLTRGVRLQEVSVSRGLTVIYLQMSIAVECGIPIECGVPVNVVTHHQMLFTKELLLNFIPINHGDGFPANCCSLLNPR